MSSTAATTTLFSRVRLGTSADVPKLHRMIHQMAVFHNLTHVFTATPELLSASLFPPPPSVSPFRVLILEVSTTPFPAPPQSCDSHVAPFHLNTTTHNFRLDKGEEDPEKDSFASDDVSIIAGYMVYFPSYAAITGKPGVFVDNIFVREFYRRKGLGVFFASHVLELFVEMGYARVEGKVMEWNVKAIKMYRDLGAEIINEEKVCRLEFGQGST